MASDTRPPKPIRITVDLDPELHQRLKMWALISGNLSLSEVVRALGEQLLQDDQLAADIRRRVGK